MNEHLDYIKWFAMFAWAPTTTIWLFYWRYLKGYKKTFLYCILGSCLFGTPWDYWATHFWLWHFSTAKTLGVTLLGIPVEEYIFFGSFAVLYASIALVLKKELKIKKI